MKKDPTLNSTQLGNILARYQKFFKPPQATIENECIKVIIDICGITLAPHQLEYRVSTRTLQIKTPSLLRSELIMQSDLILVELAKRLGDTAPTTLL